MYLQYYQVQQRLGVLKKEGEENWTHARVVKYVVTRCPCWYQGICPLLPFVLSRADNDKLPLALCKGTRRTGFAIDRHRIFDSFRLHRAMSTASVSDIEGNADGRIWRRFTKCHTDSDEKVFDWMPMLASPHKLMWVLSLYSVRRILGTPSLWGNFLLLVRLETGAVSCVGSPRYPCSGGDDGSHPLAMSWPLCPKYMCRLAIEHILESNLKSRLCVHQQAGPSVWKS